MRPFQKEKIPRPQIDVKIPSQYSFLDIEIGCGVGFHPIDYGKKNPQRLLIAIEKTKEKFDKFERRLKKHPEIQNVVALHTNAIWWITHNVRECTVDRYFILYPNPYPKDEQKRFFQMPFMSHLVETLKFGGTITLATNEKFYFEESLENAQKIWKLKVLENRILDFGEQPRTHFEKKYLERGENCYNLVLKK
jgi:tRNA G46 methylase TrmB